jgi:hypothetical protein
VRGKRYVPERDAAMPPSAVISSFKRLPGT